MESLYAVIRTHPCDLPQNFHPRLTPLPSLTNQG